MRVLALFFISLLTATCFADSGASFYGAGHGVAAVGGGSISDEFGASTQQTMSGDGAQGYDWYLLNSGAADGVDVNVSNAGELTIDHDASNTDFDTSTFSGPFVYKNITGNFDIAIDISNSNHDANYEQCALIARDPTVSAGEDHVRVISVFNGSKYVYYASTSNSTTDAGSGLTATSDAFLRITRATNTFTLYSSADGSNWTQRAQYTRNDFASTIQVGIGAGTANTSNNFVLRANYYRELTE